MSRYEMAGYAIMAASHARHGRHTAAIALLEKARAVLNSYPITPETQKWLKAVVRELVHLHSSRVSANP